MSVVANSNQSTIVPQNWAKQIFLLGSEYNILQNENLSKGIMIPGTHLYLKCQREGDLDS